MPTDPLSRLLADTDFLWRSEGEPRAPLTDIQWRADACGPGSILFFQRFDDGKSDAEIHRRYLAERPFGALVTNRMLDCFDGLPGKGIYVTGESGWAQTVGRFCDLIYPLESGRPRFLGVTGTNGKTTTVKYLESILKARGRRVLSVGTLGVSLDGEPVLETGFTSPPQIELRRLLHVYRGRCDAVAMEVSSHALDQGRVHGIPLADAGWTNFTQDHLDYHRDEASYFAAKARILDLIEAGGRLYTTSPGVAERLRGLGRAPIPVELLEAPDLGPDALAAKPFLALEHNRQNYAIAAVLAERLMGPDARSDARPFWTHLEAVDGRFECQAVGKVTLVIDFAHTPDALDTVLGAIRRGFPEARVMTLFGCGGDRDRGKRPLMGAAVARHSDLAIVTSDNPRFEDPERIVADILTGMPRERREVVLDRPQAIARLFDLLAERPADEPWVALVAGKGHERYIDRNGVKSYYSDRDEIERNLKRLGWDRGREENESANERE